MGERALLIVTALLLSSWLANALPDPEPIESVGVDWKPLYDECRSRLEKPNG